MVRYVGSGLKVSITTTVASSRKDQEYGAEQREEPVCRDEPQKSLPNLGKSLKAPLLHLYPETLRNPAEKAPQQTQDLC
jgi:hypothetical protein